MQRLPRDRHEHLHRDAFERNLDIVVCVRRRAGLKGQTAQYILFLQIVLPLRSLSAELFLALLMAVRDNTTFLILIQSLLYPLNEVIGFGQRKVDSFLGETFKRDTVRLAKTVDEEGVKAWGFHHLIRNRDLNHQ